MNRRALLIKALISVLGGVYVGWTIAPLCPGEQLVAGGLAFALGAVVAWGSWSVSWRLCEWGLG